MSRQTRRAFLTTGSLSLGAGAILGTAAGPAPAQERTGVLSYQREVPIRGRYDVVVCGGGPAGTTAALAASREGLGVLLIEAQGQLGGMATSGHVSHWLGGRTRNGAWVVGGLFKTMSEELVARKAALLPVLGPDQKYQPHGWIKGLVQGVPLDPFALARYLDEKMDTAGVDVLLLSRAVDVQVRNERITHVIVHNKSGLSAVAARCVVDATGDADVAALSGCPCAQGRAEDGLVAPATLQFHVCNVDQAALSQYIHEHESPRFRRLIRELREKKLWAFPYDIFISVQLHEEGVMMINTSRLVGIDGTDGRSVSEGMRRGRQETEELFALMKAHFPGFRNARIKSVAPLLGVRETRRITGAFVLSVNDLVENKNFTDTIGQSAYGWDLPDPKRPSHNPSHGKKRPVTPIPYRVMIPQGVKNLICPGRAISVERPVLGPLRVMAPCMAMGEAAGTATGQLLENATAFDRIDVKRLQQTLRKNGVILA